MGRGWKEASDFKLTDSASPLWSSVTSSCRVPRPSPYLHWLVAVQFSRPVVSDSLQPHGLQHSRLLCPSSTPGACSKSRPLSR